MNDDEVDVAVRVKIAAASPRPMWRFLKVRAGSRGDIGESAVSQISPENRRVLVGIELGRFAADMAVGCKHVEMTVEIQVGQDHSPAGERPAIDGQASLAGLVFVEESALRGRAARQRVVCSPKKWLIKTSGKVSPSVSPKAIPMLASARPWPLTARPSESATSSNVPSPRFLQTSVALCIVGDEPVEPSVTIEVGREDSHAAARARHAGRFRDVAESAVPFVSIENVGQAAEFLGQAIVGGAGYRVASKRCLGRVKREVIGDEEIEVAILIEVAEGGPEAPASAADSRFFGHVGEPALLAIVSPERVSAVTRHVHVGIAVGIVVSHRHPLTISLGAELHAAVKCPQTGHCRDF